MYKVIFEPSYTKTILQDMLYIYRGETWEISCLFIIILYIHLSTYSVMQSVRNNHWGDVVLDSVNMAFEDEGSVLDQNYEKLICSVFCHEYFDFA